MQVEELNFHVERKANQKEKKVGLWGNCPFLYLRRELKLDQIRGKSRNMVLK